MASSSSSRYDVFLSFRGKDTRENFTSFLFDALCRKKIKTFIDEDLERGDEISPALLDAIEGSKISAIIFSKDYADSKWCLDELVKILECKRIYDQIVVPVFYHVHPSDVRKQTGSFGKAFVEHGKKFKKMPEMVQKWRDALTEASYLAGHESEKIRPEVKLVGAIVEDILKKLEKATVSLNLKGLIGINSRIERLKSLLCIGLSDFRIVGIWGMGGVGKTTIAEALFNQISEEFEGKFFMANVREKSEKGGGLEHLQKEIISHLLEEDLEMGGPNIPQYTKERLRRTKVFIVLDDVNKFGQLEYLAGGVDRFGPGSRIIVTTRDKQVLDRYGVDRIYKVEELNSHEALKHFCNFAFRQNHPPEDLMMLSKRVVDYAKGNPLAIKVLGSFLYPKSTSDWEIALDHFKQISDPAIFDVLKVSYDELNHKMKNIFLDIACFFNGEDKSFVTSIFSDCYSIDYGVLDVLVDKSLLSVSLFNELEMHDLLQEMGREIVHQESEEEPGRRSRLWYHKDILHVLNKNKGTDSVKGIFLDLSKLEYIKLSSRAFSNMSSLRLLKFYMPRPLDISDAKFEVDLFQGLDYLSDELRYLHWHGYPFRMLPTNFNPENLIALSLPCSKVEQLWEGKKEACKLKSIDLNSSQYPIRIPDPSEAPNLERDNLSNCVMLPCIPSPIQNFNSLAILCLKGCESLTCFPSNIHFNSPITIDLSFCDNFTEFPQVSGKIMGLNLFGTAIEEVPSSVESLTDLQKLDLGSCKRLKILSTSICKLKSLSELYLDCCSKLKCLPEILEKMERLEYISLDSSAIKELPSSIENVVGLQTLCLTDCSELDALPENLRNLKSLNVIDGKGSGISQLPSSFEKVSQLRELLFSGCKGLVLPSFSGLSFLKKLALDDCEIMEIPEDIGCLSSLESLNLMGNNFESLPTSIKQLSLMKKLILSNCNMLQSLPELPLSLFCLEATNCNQLQSLPELPSPCLEQLDASILERFSQHYHDYMVSTELDFSHCRKLNESTNNNILADSHLRQRMVIATVTRFCEKGFITPYGVSICLPGSGIPDWFSNQSSGSSIKVQLPQLCCNRNLIIGFALFAVIAFEELFHVDDDFVIGPFHADKDFEVVCRYRSETKSIARHFVFKTRKNYKFEDYLNYVSNHVYLGFDARPIVGISDGDHGTVSFDFDVSPSYFGEWPKVKCCGVCPIYAHSTKNQPSCFTIKMVPPSEEECRELNEFHDEAGTSGTATETGNIGRYEEEESNAPQQRNSFLSQIFRCLGLGCNCFGRYE